jgi:DNA-directed RNA polymerase
LDIREQQQYNEEENDLIAATTKLTALRADAAKGNAELPRASKLIARMYSEIALNLQAFLAEGTRGPGGKLKNWLRALPTDLAAVIALRECIRMLSIQHKPTNIQTIASSIGKLWELEVRIREAEAVNPMYMKRIHEQVKERCTTDQRHLRKVYNFAYSQVMKGELDSQLSQSELIQLGKHGLNACMEAGVVFSTRNTQNQAQSKKLKTSVLFFLTPEIEEFLHDYTADDVQGVMDKEAGAMLCSPDPWTDISDGGYLSPRRKLHSPLMSLRNIRAEEKARVRREFTAENMPLVFKAGNYLQSEPYMLHKPTVDAMVRVLKDGGGVMGVPRRTQPQKPVCPLPEDWVKSEGTPEEQEVFSFWKRRVVKYYDAVTSWKGHMREITGSVRVMTGNEGKPIWFPMYLDTRGRWYYRGTPNPQGSDLSKAVLHRHERKALGVRGLFWLKVHIANSFGYDKERFVDRAAWTDKHWANIERALDEPENNLDVWGTDAPWCMFSAAWELREALRSGSPHTYCTGIIVHMDATCSGLQHFSALLRDPVGGQYVNLTDELKCGPKQDIYSRVSTMSLMAMQRDLESDDPEIKAMAAWWIETGIPRGMAKKPVMTYVYGATLRGTCSYIRDYVYEEMPIQFPSPDVSHVYSNYCAKKLFQGIAATVPSAEYAMNWLRSVAKDQPKGQRMQWKTPTGFLVQHDYLDHNEKEVYLRSCGMHKCLVRVPNGGTRPIQMQNAIAPNFVHALDASHLTLTALKMQEQGLSMVGIHDSFGTHACDVDTLHTAARDAFVEMYQNSNLLGEFLWDVGVQGEAPMRGMLNIQDVKESEFFFS